MAVWTCSPRAPGASPSAELAGTDGVGLPSHLKVETRLWAFGFSPWHLPPGDGEGGGALPAAPKSSFFLGRNPASFRQAS